MSDTWMSYTAQLSIADAASFTVSTIFSGHCVSSIVPDKSQVDSHESSIVGSYPERPIYGQIRGNGSKFQSASKSTVMHNAADFN